MKKQADTKERADIKEISSSYDAKKIISNYDEVRNKLINELMSLHQYYGVDKSEAKIELRNHPHAHKCCFKIGKLLETIQSNSTDFMPLSSILGSLKEIITETPKDGFFGLGSHTIMSELNKLLEKHSKKAEDLLPEEKNIISYKMDAAAESEKPVSRGELDAIIETALAEKVGKEVEKEKGKFIQEFEAMLDKKQHEAEEKAKEHLQRLIRSLQDDSRINIQTLHHKTRELLMPSGAPENEKSITVVSASSSYPAVAHAGATLFNSSSSKKLEAKQSRFEKAKEAITKVVGAKRYQVLSHLTTILFEAADRLSEAQIKVINLFIFKIIQQRESKTILAVMNEVEEICSINSDLEPLIREIKEKLHPLLLPDSQDRFDATAINKEYSLRKQHADIYQFYKHEILTVESDKEAVSYFSQVCADQDFQELSGKKEDELDSQQKAALALFEKEGYTVHPDERGDQYVAKFKEAIAKLLPASSKLRG